MSTVLLEANGLGLALADVAHKPLFGAAPTKHILNGVSFRLEAGGTLGVIGESGSGKSTLARALTMLMPPTAGEVLFQGRAVRAFTPAELVAYRTQVQLVFQDPMSSLNPRRRVGAIVTQPLRALGRLARLIPRHIGICTATTGQAHRARACARGSRRGWHWDG